MKFTWTTRMIAAGGLLAVPAFTMAEAPEGRKPDRAALFQRLDSNGDGIVTKDEVPEEKRGQFDRLLRESDKNGDGQVSKDEFLASGDQGRPAGGPGAGRPDDSPPAEVVFQHTDANGDGKLERSEVPEGRREGFDRMVDNFDTDNDGKLNLEEFRKGFAISRGMPVEGPRPDGPPGGPQGPGAPSPLFAALDTNHDGKISGDELYSATASLKKLDRDGNGTITLQEASAGSREGEPGKRPGGAPATGAAGGMNAEAMIARLKQADTNGDGKLSKDEAPERMRENFDRIDQNGDGFIDEKEMKQVAQLLSRAGGPGKGPAGAGAPGGGGILAGMMKQADKNGDGKLSKDEAPERMRDNFDRIDQNGDGFIDDQELQGMIGRMKK